MKNNLDIIEKIVKNVHCIVGIPIVNTRQQPHVQLRAAIAIALIPRFSRLEICEVLKRDRTAVNYWKKTHDANMMYWGDYDKYYSIAQEQTESVYGIESDNYDLKILDKEIEMLLGRRKKLIEGQPKITF